MHRRVACPGEPTSHRMSKKLPTGSRGFGGQRVGNLGRRALAAIKAFAQVESFESLLRWFPTICADLTLGRAQIVREQVRGAVSAPEQLLFVTARAEPHAHAPQAAIITLLPTGAAVSQGADTATVIHAGRLGSGRDRHRHADTDAALAAALLDVLQREWQRRNVRLAQWATDPSPAPGANSGHWPTTLGFESIGTLSYLCGAVPPAETPGSGNRVHLRALDWPDQRLPTDFVQLVEQTYHATLDCPALSRFRSVRQVLSGYQAQATFDPRLWFTATGPDGKAIGCAIFAVHGPSLNEVGRASGQGVRSLEIIYLGLIPAARGQRAGARILDGAFATARQLGAEQVLVAVDQQNTPALSIYRAAGMRSVIEETVWVKSVDSNRSGPDSDKA